MTPAERSALHQRLAEFLPSQLDELARSLGMPAGHQPARELNGADRANQFLQWAEQNPARLASVQQAVGAMTHQAVVVIQPVRSQAPGRPERGWSAKFLRFFAFATTDPRFNHPLFKTILDDIRRVGDVRIDAVDHLASLDLDNAVIDDFLLFAFRMASRRHRKYRNRARLAVARTAAILLRHRDAGRQTVQEALRVLSAEGVNLVLGGLGGISTAELVPWVHSLFVDQGGSLELDSHYKTFLALNADLLVSSVRNDVESYLLHPDRGPGCYNIDSFFVFLKRCDSPKLVERWRSWIWNREEELARTHHLGILREAWDGDLYGRMQPIFVRLHERVRHLLFCKSDASKQLRAFKQIYALLDSNYPLISELRSFLSEQLSDEGVSFHETSFGRDPDFQTLWDAMALDSSDDPNNILTENFHRRFQER
jgi:hypothetical protein